MAPDPFYDRKPVPDALIKDIGYTGLNPAEELEQRERKYSVGGGDLRKFSNPKIKGEKGEKLDPHYARKQVPDALIHDVGYTGLSKEEEFLNRERKFSVNGSDIRKFGDKDKGFHPSDDPYYGRKSVPEAQLEGVGEIPNMTPAQLYAAREEKEAMFDLSKDPFAEVTGRGHRASVVDAQAVAYATSAQQAGQRRRSSAVAPDHAQHAAHNSGYQPDDRLAPVESRHEEPEITPNVGHDGHTPIAAAKDGSGHLTGNTGHTTFYDAATKDLDSVAPHEVR